MSLFYNVYIVLVGCGGTGSYFAPHLGRLFGRVGELRSIYPSNILFIDADRVSQANVVRQNFVYYDINEIKSKVLKERVQQQSELSRIDNWATYANQKVLNRIVQKSGSFPLIFISCVDNHRTRNRLLSLLKPDPDSWENCMQKNWLLLDSGNDLLSGWTSSLCYFDKVGYGIDMRQQDTEIRNNSVNDAPVVNAEGGVVRGCGYEGSPNEFFWGNQQNAMLLAANLRSICLDGQGYGLLAWEKPDFKSDKWLEQAYQTHFLLPYTLSK